MERFAGGERNRVRCAEEKPAADNGGDDRRRGESGTVGITTLQEYAWGKRVIRDIQNADRYRKEAEEDGRLGWRLVLSVQNGDGHPADPDDRQTAVRASDGEGDLTDKSGERGGITGGVQYGEAAVSRHAPRNAAARLKPYAVRGAAFNQTKLGEIDARRVI